MRSKMVEFRNRVEGAAVCFLQSGTAGWLLLPFHFERMALRGRGASIMPAGVAARAH